MKKPRLIYLIIWLKLLLIGGSSAADENLHVTASIPPLHSLVASIMGVSGKPEMLMTGGMSPHASRLKPSQAILLSRSKLVFRISGTFETALNKPLKTMPKSVPVITMLKEQGANPHIWLDPRGAEAMARTILKALIRADPANSAYYRINADRLSSRLKALEEELNEQLAPVRQRPFVVYHDAYGYFTRRFALAEEGYVTAHPGQLTGAARIGGLRKMMFEKNIICIFTEPQFTPRLAKKLIAGTDVKHGHLDPLGIGIEPGPELYFTLMLNMARSLRACLAKS